MGWSRKELVVRPISSWDGFPLFGMFRFCGLNCDACSQDLCRKHKFDLSLFERLVVSGCDRAKLVTQLRRPFSAINYVTMITTMVTITMLTIPTITAILIPPSPDPEPNPQSQNKRPVTSSTDLMLSAVRPSGSHQNVNWSKVWQILSFCSFLLSRRLSDLESRALRTGLSAKPDSIIL